MKKLFAPIVAAFFAFTTINGDWKTVTLTQNVTVSLPAAAKEDNTKGMAMQRVVLEDSTELNAFALDYSTFGMDSAMLQSMAGTDQFREQMEAGIGMQPGIKLVKNETGKYNDKYISYDMALEMEKDGKKTTINNRTVFYKQYGITLIFKQGDKGDNAALREKFFNSVKITD